MCGIVGYIGQQGAAGILVNGLRSLEYRGYDSAGIALASGSGEFKIIRASGKLANLAARVDLSDPTPLGIGHTRWATHGRPTEENAHPHCSADGQVVAVHNGIFENFLELRAELKSAGETFRSETDTECFPVMVSHLMKQGRTFAEAFREAVGRMQGIYALACLHATDPDRILAARNGPPMVLGLGEGETFLASDVVPLLPHTRRVIFLEDGDLAELTRGGVRIYRMDGREVERPVLTIPYDPVAAEKGGYKHFMQKEIFEQPQALSNTLLNRLPLDGEEIPLDLPFTEQDLAELTRIHIVACGTSWHAGLVGKFLIEQLSRVAVEVDYASEYRYRNPIAGPGSLGLLITQSGETADTLAAQREMKALGSKTVAICNVVDAMVAREAHGSIYTHAGPEIGVASTKAFTAQLTALFLLALKLGQLRGHLDKAQSVALIEELSRIPGKIEEVLRSRSDQCEQLAKEFSTSQDFLYLGRGIHFPIALEGALKMKEISYIHAEGYPAGEMKHGPNALIDETLPVVVLATRDERDPASKQRYEKTLSNIQEVTARSGRVIAVATEGDTTIGGLVEHVIHIPPAIELLSPLIEIVPLQLLAYFIAVRRGCDVDQPRNLAKSVTVE